MLKHKQRKRFLILTILMLLVSVMLRPQAGIAVVSDGDGQLVVGSGNFQIEINGRGQVPFYHFNASDTAFFLKFQQLVQYTDANENGFYDTGELVGGQTSTLQLTSIQWAFSDNSVGDSIEFIFTSSKINNPLFNDVSIELINKYHTGALAVKFDIIISGWPFVAEADGLSLEFELIWSQDSAEEDAAKFSKISDETGIYLYNTDEVLVAYFDMTSEITTDVDGIISDTAILHDTASEHASILNVYINYPKFDMLVHDPEFGTSKDALPSLTDPTAIVLWLEENVKAGFLGITIITTVLLMAIATIARKTRYR